MLSLKTPGVYLEETAKLPPSVAEVATAIPAFIGHTQITNKIGNKITPVRINSLSEYESLFGNADVYEALIEIQDTVIAGSLTKRTTNVIPALDFYTSVMYYHIQLYFANGGGPCYIVSVGGPVNPYVSKSDLIAGLDAIENISEPTLLVFPDAAYLEPTIVTDEADPILANKKSVSYSRNIVYKAALQQCARVKNRFLIMDCLDEAPEFIRHSNYGIGNDNLQFGAAYFPFLKTDIGYCVAMDYRVEINHYINGISIENLIFPFAYDTNNELANVAAQAVKDVRITLSPSSAIAAVYASTDRTRGVWKAPANVSLNRVTGTTIAINDEDQASLNIDPVAGKSINAIRNFAGKGTIVWGARTLAGNSNEWRYVSVRRLFSMAESSIRNAVENFVFENNDANTWTKVQAMIENYLTGLWREGALQGAKPEQAFYVAVGLNKTMTAQDVLEGKMVIEVGMAAVRPAEFIVLRFSHLMATS